MPTKWAVLTFRLCLLEKYMPVTLLFLITHFLNFQYLFKPALLIILGAAGFSIVYKQFSSRPTAKATINTIAILILIVAMVIMAILIPFIAPYADVTYMQTYGVVVILCSALVIASELSVFSKNTMFILGLVIIVCFTTRTNAQYYRAQLITEASIHTVNRVFSRIEQAEGFSCDKKLAIIGHCQQVSQNRDCSAFFQ